MSEIPVLQTDRLILRPHRATDIGACLSLWSDPETVRFIGGEVQDMQAVWFRMLRYAGLWSLLGYGFWAIEDRASGRYLGEGGFTDSRRGIVELLDVPEAGWALLPVAAGRGLATEALGAILRWADEALDAPVTRCIIDPANGASLRVAGKAGFREIARIGTDSTPLILLERPRGG